MKVRLGFVVLLLALWMPAYSRQANANISAEGGKPDDRASARILFWDNAKHAGAGEFAIDYGRPMWKSAYEDPAQFDKMTKGKIWRLGSNFWTTLDTCVPLTISGKKVPAGYYYLGLHRSDDGSKWGLVLIDPARVRSMRLDAFNIDKAPISFEIPMTPASATAKAEKLTITLQYFEPTSRSAMLNIAWGTLALTAPIEVSLSE
jgi:hypothetical protein